MLSRKNKKIFAGVFAIFVFAALVNFAKAEVYFIELYRKDDGKLDFDKKSAKPVRLLPINFVNELVPLGDYKAQIISFNDAVLNKIYFNPVTLVSQDWYDFEAGKFVGGMKILSGSYPYKLTLPYYPNAQYAEIFDPDGNKQLKIYLTAFARCNENKICEAGETEKECPSDCRPEPPLTTFGKLWRLSLTFLYWLAFLGLIAFLAIKIKNKIRKKKNAQ